MKNSAYCGNDLIWSNQVSKSARSLTERSNLQTRSFFSLNTHPETAEWADMIVAGDEVNSQLAATFRGADQRPLFEKVIPRNENLVLRVKVAVEHEHSHASFHEVDRAELARTT